MEEDDGLVLNLAGTDDPLPQEPLKPRDSRNRWTRQHEQKKKVKPTELVCNFPFMSRIAPSTAGFSFLPCRLECNGSLRAIQNKPINQH